MSIPSDIKSLPNSNDAIWLDGERVRVLFAIGGLLLVRIAYLYSFPLGLAPDETYYWEWSRHLDWSYYSKPPLIAWIIAAAVGIGGVSEFSIRLPAALLASLGLLAVYELSRRLYNHRVAVWATAAVSATPGMTVLSVLMTIDAPFLCAWSISLYCLWRLFEAEAPNVRWLLPSIVATGMGLLSKQTTLALLPLTFLFLMTAREDRQKLRSFAFWAWSLGSLCFTIPVLWWNWQHQWVTVAHTQSHFQAASASLTERLTWFFEFWAAQFGILSPGVCALLLIVTIFRLASFRSLDRQERFLICFGAIPTTAVSILCFSQRVLPNWPVAFHLTGIILCAAWGSDAVMLSHRMDRFRTWFKPAVYVGAALSIAVAAIPHVLPVMKLDGTKCDLTMRLRGWNELGRQVGDQLQQFPELAFVISSTPRTVVSELAFYLPGRPNVCRWNDLDEIDSQYDLWEKPRNVAGQDALIVTAFEIPVPKPLTTAFDSIQELGEIFVPIGPERAHHFRLWKGTNFRDWPANTTALKSLANDPRPPVRERR